METIWTCSIIYEKVLNQWFYLLNAYIRGIHVFDVIYKCFDNLCFMKFFIPSKLLKWLTCLFIIFLYYVFNTCQLYSDSFSFTLDIGNFCVLFFFLYQCCWGLSILLIFLKKHILVLLFFTSYFIIVFPLLRIYVI